MISVSSYVQLSPLFRISLQPQAEIPDTGRHLGGSLFKVGTGEGKKGLKGNVSCHGGRMGLQGDGKGAR